MDSKKMDPIIDLIWSVEEEDTETFAASTIRANCGGSSGGGGGCCVACCCSVPSILTKWLCPN